MPAVSFADGFKAFKPDDANVLSLTHAQPQQRELESRFAMRLGCCSRTLEQA